MKRINVTKSFLPPYEDYEAYLRQIWASGHLTNQGPLLQEFEKKIEEYLNVSNFHLVSNGTSALQISLRALGITEGEIITTPFSYVATTSSILWERCKPVFVDIKPSDFCIDVAQIEAAITPLTKAIMPVHVFGYACDVERIDAIAKKHNLKVIYDAAHAFGSKINGKSLLSYGDISICSFHSTKLFHTIEGGGVIVNNKEFNDSLELIKRFGHNGDDHLTLGINAKASEFQAAMGLCNLNYVDTIIQQRAEISTLYKNNLPDFVEVPVEQQGLEYNWAYFPVLFKNEKHLLEAFERLNRQEIYPRRYFYPSLNTIPYINSTNSCPNSEDVSSRIACLPFYPGLSAENVIKICRLINL